MSVSEDEGATLDSSHLSVFSQPVDVLVQSLVEALVFEGQANRSTKNVRSITKNHARPPFIVVTFNDKDLTSWVNLHQVIHLFHEDLYLGYSMNRVVPALYILGHHTKVQKVTKYNDFVGLVVLVPLFKAVPGYWVVQIKMNVTYDCNSLGSSRDWML